MISLSRGETDCCLPGSPCTQPRRPGILLSRPSEPRTQGQKFVSTSAKRKKKTSLDLNRDLAEWDEEQHTEAPLQSPQSQRSMAAQVISLGSRRSSEDQMNILKARGADCQNAPRKNKGPFCSLGPPAR